MLPSRGLPPRQLASLASRQSSALRSATSRKFSSIPSRTALSASCRTSSLRSSNWRTGASPSSNVVLSPSAIRHASWYAPWTWVRSSTPSDAASQLASEPTPVSEVVPEPAVTTATPELQPAGVETTAVSANPTTILDGRSVEDVLEIATKATDSSFIDPSLPLAYWGNLKDLGLDYGWGPSAFFESMLEVVYINAELGWAGTIVASALILRTGLFFTFQRWGSDAMAKSAAMKPILQPLQDEMEEAKRQGDDQRVQMLKMKQQTIMKDVGVDVFKSMGTAIAQGVFGYGAWRSLRGISSLPAPGITTDGWLWFTDLSVADPYYLLPVITGGIMYQVIRRGGETGMQDQTAQTGLQKQVQVVLPIVMAAVTAFQPAAIQLYFFATSITGAITGYSLRQPAVRRVLGIRQLPTAQSNELWGKVARGEIDMNSVKTPDGKIRYQAPNAPASRNHDAPSGLKLKSSASLPAHMRAASMQQAVAEEPKTAWEQLKSTPNTIKGKISKWQDPRDPDVKKQQDAAAKQARELKKYMAERKKRLR
ncbi:hypothetical protein PMIN04_011748 [Paraphaeosphaeria minitans]